MPGVDVEDSQMQIQRTGGAHLRAPGGGRPMKPAAESSNSSASGSSQNGSFGMNRRWHLAHLQQDKLLRYVSTFGDLVMPTISLRYEIGMRGPRFSSALPEVQKEMIHNLSFTRLKEVSNFGELLMQIVSRHFDSGRGDHD